MSETNEAACFLVLSKMKYYDRPLLISETFALPYFQTQRFHIEIAP